MWVLPRPRYRGFAAPAAAALVHDWNGRHRPDQRVVRLELRFARLGRTRADDTLHDLLLAAWPPRDAQGAGGLDRLLESLEAAAARSAENRPPAVEEQEAASVD
jgi:hypothetical protein